MIAAAHDSRQSFCLGVSEIRLVKPVSQLLHKRARVRWCRGERWADERPATGHAAQRAIDGQAVAIRFPIC